MVISTLGKEGQRKNYFFTKTSKITVIELYQDMLQPEENGGSPEAQDK